ncbi:Hypothetical protein SRAE_X000250600 [Strongyloides ratti]|uniref:Uncharacterized protein n=1 Tax=Strongyloides ratti TaxID=34506 RepID=A0A090KTJ1_STRRB|nr:Hypothetical protein SRAE_X000250600 [Strongyloides ratti]CEF60830.1 Hypothetical protein SRAE_X000250600 [Strongyloides ratti]
MSTSNIKYSKENYSYYDSALSSLNDLSSLNNIDTCLESNKRITKVPNIQSQSFNRLISSFTTPKPSKIPILLSQSMSECHKSKKEHFKSVLLHSSYSNNDEITLGSCEQLTEMHLSPRIKAENLLKACKKNKVISCTKYSKPSLLSPLIRDIRYSNNNNNNNITNSLYFNEQSSGLGSSIITIQSFFDESEEKEIKNNVDKYMSFTKMRHSLKIYRNQMGGFDEDYYKKPNWLFLSSRGSCRMCKHIPSFIINYRKIRKKNVVKRRPCICNKVQSIYNTNFNGMCSQILSNFNDKKILINFEIPLLQDYIIIFLIPGAIAFLVETLYFIISVL